MILSDIANFLKQRKQCSLSDLALHFDTNADAMRGMLALWIRKGKVIKRNTTPSCGTSCQSCDPSSTEIYYWHQQTTTVSVTLPSNCQH